VLTEGPGWRWVLFVYPPVCLAVIAAIYALIPNDRRARVANFDLPGAVFATSGMLLLVYALVKAPDIGWGATRTIAELAGAAVLLGAFLVNEQRNRNPLLPLSIFRIRGLGAADATQLIAIAGFLAMFFFLTLYMQNVLGYSPMKTGVAYLPVCGVVVVVAGVTSQFVSRVGTRALIVVGALIAAGGVYWLSRIPVHGSYASDLLPGLVIMSVGLGMVFVANTTAANAGVPADKAGLAAALLNASQQVGGALGLAIFSAIATSHTNQLLANGTPVHDALTSGFHRALLTSSIFLVAAAVIGMKATNTRGELPESDEPQVAVGEEAAQSAAA
jgi:predicted MFS family arabinose efflux permease